MRAASPDPSSLSPALMFNSLLFAGLALVTTPLDAADEAAVEPQAPRSGELIAEDLASPAGVGSSLPYLVAGAAGEVYLSWVEPLEGGADVVRFSALKDQGWSAPIDLVRGTDLFLNWADFPSLTVSASGALIAHWLRQGSDPHGYNAEFSISTDQGKTWSEPQVLHSDTSPVEHGFISIAPLGAAGFGAIWLDGRHGLGQDHGPHGGGEMALYFRSISVAGELGEEQVLDSRVCDCCQTSLIATPGGGLLATYRDRSPEEVRDISFVRFDGKSWSKPALVHEDGWLIPGCPVNGPRLAVGDGFTGAAWFTGAGDDGGDVRLAFKRGAAQAFSKPLEVDDGSPMGRVDLVSLGADSVVISWLEHTEDGAEWRVRRCTSKGGRSRSLTIAEVHSDRASGFLRMVSTGEAAILAWTTSGPERRVELVRLSRQP